MYDIIDERFTACNAVIKTILEVLIGTGTVAPHAVANRASVWIVARL
jgi:hypothetical protein